jgi:hypothetical protein
VTPDTSVIIAAFAPWHAAHVDSLAAIRDVQALVAHAELEAYSVLTRLPPPHRVPGPIAAEYLARQYAGGRLVLDQRGRRGLVERIADRGITGGATYDALIGLTAAAHDMPLLTRDARAAATYNRLGVPYEAV